VAVDFRRWTSHRTICRDPKSTVDFRTVYATLMEEWLGCPASAVLSGSVRPAAVLT
jgi:uncharacterized protein (DUF1501 family)